MKCAICGCKIIQKNFWKHKHDTYLGIVKLKIKGE